MLRAIRYFAEAIRRAPGYAPAHSGLADCYSLLATHGVLPSGEPFPRAKAAALRAVELDDQLAEAHASLANILAFHGWDREAARLEFGRAVAFKPRDATIRQWHGILLIAGYQQFEQGLTEIRLGLRADPLSLTSRVGLAYGLYFARQYQDAAEERRQVLELEPDSDMALLMLRCVCQQLGRRAEAAESFDRAQALGGGDAIRAKVAVARSRGGDCRGSRGPRDTLRAQYECLRLPLFPGGGTPRLRGSRGGARTPGAGLRGAFRCGCAG